MNNTGLVVRVWNDAAIARRDEDGYANATAMCQANGREWKAYHRIDRTQEYIQALATSLGLTPADLVITTTTGPNEFRGTWIHPRLAVDLARWISPEFAVWMDGWFLEQLEHQPQAPGLTAEDVARIAAEVARGTVQATVQTVHAIPQLPSEAHHTICCGDAIVSVMADAHSRGHRVITRRLLLDEVVKRFGYCSRTVDNTMPTLINSRQVVRHSHGRYQLSPLPDVPALKLQPQASFPEDDTLELMQTIRQCAVDARGLITWHDLIDRYSTDTLPNRARVWEAMEALDAMGAGIFCSERKTFRVVA